MKYIIHIILLTLVGVGTVYAGGIYKQSTPLDYDTAYKNVYAALEENQFYVVQEINIGKNLSRFQDKWENYNLNKLEKLQVMIICNGWYANQVSNADTDMLALCPMRITLIQKAGITTVLFARPSTFAEDSKALPILQKAEGIIIEAIRSALK